MQHARYHSLVVERDSLPDDFTSTRRRADGAIMAVSHRDAADLRHPVPSRVVRHDRRRSADPQFPAEVRAMIADSDPASSSMVNILTARRCTTSSAR